MFLSLAISTRRFRTLTDFKYGTLRSPQMKISTQQPHPPDVFVQTLPIVTIPSAQNLEGGSKSLNKILLCKWTSGNFKDRYTGLIKPLSQKEFFHSASSSEKQTLLRDESFNLLPPNIRKLINKVDLELVGCLRFDDPPACDEYIYKAKLLTGGSSSGDWNFDEVIHFDQHPCHLFNWEDIPFSEMPADDEVWYPEVLWKKRKVTGSFTFGGWAERGIKSYSLNVVDKIM